MTRASRAFDNADLTGAHVRGVRNKEVNFTLKQEKQVDVYP